MGAEKEVAKAAAAEKKAATEEKTEHGISISVYKMSMHCEGCAMKIKRTVQRMDGVKDVKTDCSSDKLTVTGKIDPAKVKERLEEITNKKVEIVLASPKKDGSGEKKEEKKSNEKKPEEKKAEEKKPLKESTVFLKMKLHCDCCISKIKKTVAKTKGKYSDELYCDIVDMEVCEIVLGQPWLFDRDVMHSGRHNTYSFTKDGTKYKLMPAGQRKPVEPQQQTTLQMTSTRAEFLFNMKEAKEVHLLVVKGEDDRTRSPKNIPNHAFEDVQVNQEVKLQLEKFNTKEPNHVLDLVKLPKATNTSTASEKKVSEVVHIHKEGKQQLNKANAKYQQAADVCKQNYIFDPGDEAMVFLSKNKISDEGLGYARSNSGSSSHQAGVNDEASKQTT